MRFSRGLVSGIEPTIGGVPISGLVNGVQGAQPVLKLDAGVVASGDNRSWACVEIVVDATGKISPMSTATVEHRATWFLEDPLGKTGRQAICMILWQNGQPASVFPILYFNPVAQLAIIPNGTTSTIKKFFFT